MRVNEAMEKAEQIDRDKCMQNRTPEENALVTLWKYLDALEGGLIKEFDALQQ